MSDESLFDLQYFDRRQEYSVVFKRLPHWAQAGTISFITWRTADSLPKAALARLNRRRQELLRQHQLDPDADWRQELAKLPSAVGSGAAAGRVHRVQRVAEVGHIGVAGGD